VHHPEADDLISRLETSLAMISHELRTPLTPVFLSLEMLRGDESLTQFAGTFELMERNLRMQLRLIDELKDLVQVSHHKLGLVLKPIDAHAAIGSAMGICAEKIAERQIVTRLDLGASNFTVLADALKLQQIVWNIIQNAIKFSKPGGIISLTSRSSASGAFVLEVTDEGAGIESAFLPHVFEAFKQSFASACRKSGSLGLGMYIAHGLAEAQNGTLSVTSDGLGYGCTFRLSLPCAQSAEPVELLEYQKPIGPSRERLKNTFAHPSSFGA
jgi:signal transduction histidine kinase